MAPNIEKKNRQGFIFQMSEPKEPTPAPAKTEEPTKTKKATKPKAEKKTVTKKATTKKETPKKAATKKAAPKKTAAKKDSAKKATKKLVKKAVKPKKTVKKSTEKKPAKEATTKKAAPKAAKFGKYDHFVAEAIVANATEEKQWVSYAKIKQYLLDYMDGAIVAMIPKQCKKAILALVAKKYLKAKKESYAFTAKGKEKLAPAKAEKRKKIERPVKKAAPEPKEEPKKENRVTMSGRVSKSVF